MTIINGWKLAIPMPQYSAFKGRPFEEHLDLVLMKMIKDDPRCLDEWRETLDKIINNTDVRTNKQYVKHKQPYGIGRHYSEDNTPSIINLKREIKHSIMEYLGWMDLDMIKAHPSIVCELGRKNGVEFQHIRNYLNDPEYYNQMLIQYYSGDPENPVNADDIKELIRSAGYGGGFKSWRDALGKDLLHQNKHQFIADFIADCRKAIELVYLNNPQLVDKVKEDETNIYKIKSRTMSYFCGAIENDALHIAYKFLIKKDLLRERTGALEYDGLCFKPLKAFNIPVITTELNDLIRSKLGLELKFKIKGYDRVMFADLIEARRQIVEAEPVGVMTVDAEAVSGDNDDLRLARNYPQWKAIFEKTHCKIINKSTFIKAVRDIDGTFKEFVIFKEQELKASYRHCCYIKMTKMGEQEAFYIEDWLKDPMMRLYEDIDCIPPPLKCPSSIFNLWSPFRAEQLKCPDMDIGEDDTEEEQQRKQVIIDNAYEKVGYIQNHIKVLLNNDAVVYDYFMMWLGQMLKYPAIKTIAPCLISQQGSGKGTIIKYMKAMMGNKKVLETAEPEKVVWGHFNELMMNCYFVSLNEMEKRAQEQADGRIKALITDGDLTINPKGKGHINTTSYHRFMYSSNNEVPVQTEEGDRRNLIIRCSDEWKIRPNSPTFDRNVKHFEDLNAWLEDDNVIWLLYKCLTSIDGLDKFHKLPLPITEYQAIIQDANKKPVERWFKEWVGINFTEGETIDDGTGHKFIKIQSKRLLDEFKTFKDANSVKWETNTAKLVRDIQLLQLPQGTITTYKQGAEDPHKLHTRTGNLIMLNMDKLKQHFGLLNAVYHETEETTMSGDMELDEDTDM